MEPSNFVPIAPHGMASFGAGILVVFYTVVGFEMLTVVAGEARDPSQERTESAARNRLLAARSS